MGQIKEYLHRTDAVGPTPNRLVNPDDFTQVARATQGLGQSLQGAAEALYRRKVQEETLNATVKLSEKHAEIRNKLDDAHKKGNLNVDEFLKEFDTEVASINDEVTTKDAKDYVAKNLASMRASFVESTFKLSADIAATQSVDALGKIHSNETNGLLKNPADFENSLTRINSLVDQLVLTKHLPYDKALQLKSAFGEDFAKTAVRGWIGLNPEDAIKDLNDGKWKEYFSADVTRQLLGEAQRELDSRKTDEALTLQREKEELKKRIEETQLKFVHAWDDKKLTAKMVRESILPPMGQGGQKYFLDLLKAEAENRINGKSDPNVVIREFANIHREFTDPKKLTNPTKLIPLVTQGLISKEDFKDLRREIERTSGKDGEVYGPRLKLLYDLATKTFIENDKMSKIGYSDGPVIFLRVKRQMSAIFDDWVAKNKNPDELFDENSPNYLGKIIEAYEKDIGQKIRGNINRMLGKNIGTTPLRVEDLSPTELQQIKGTKTESKDTKETKPENKSAPKGETYEEYYKRVMGVDI